MVEISSPPGVAVANHPSRRGLLYSRKLIVFIFLSSLRGLGGFFLILPLWGLGGLGFVYAHPMPNSVVVLNIHENHYTGQIQLPLAELQSAIGMSVNDNSDRLVEHLGDSLRIYYNTFAPNRLKANLGRLNWEK